MPPAKKPRTVDDVPMVVVRWRDASIEPRDELDLNSPVDAANPPKFGATPIMRDLGFLVEWTDERIALAVSGCESDHSLRHSNTIPSRMILPGGVRLLNTGKVIERIPEAKEERKSGRPRGRGKPRHL